MSSNEDVKLGGTGPRKYLCNDCNRTFALKASLLRHKAFECNRGRQPYERHPQDDYDRSRKSKKKHVCIRCNRVYAFFTSLWRHQKYECGVEPKFVCPICKGRFAQKRFAYGFRKPEDPTNTSLTCPQCGRTYKMKRNLRTHMKFECGEFLSIVSRGPVNEPPKNSVVFNCHQCGRSYQMRHNLVKHLRFECGGQKHFACSLCPSRYTQNGFYEGFHTPENLPAVYGRKPHVTPMKIARVKLNARHPGNAEDQALQCSACGKRYSLKHNLARHVRFECGGQRKFSCHLCPNKYTQNVSLRRHLTHHHNVVVPVKKRYNSARKMYADRIVYQ
ncbi:hypothetical protein P5V15_004090 [Pogonomyrmex californicus]